MFQDRMTEAFEKGIERFRNDPEFRRQVWQAMIDDGIIDEKGRVLKRIPLRPPWLEDDETPPANGEAPPPADAPPPPKD